MIWPSKDDIQDANYWRGIRRVYVVYVLVGAGFIALFGRQIHLAWRLAAHAEQLKPSLEAKDVKDLQDSIHNLRVAMLKFAFGIAYVAAGGAWCAWRVSRATRRILQAEGRCIRCRYDLRGQTEPRCPECGTPFDLPKPVNSEAK